MSKLHRISKTNCASLAAVAWLALTAMPLKAVDWNRVEGKEIILFYPGQSSWEWALTLSDHSGASRFREGKNCKECHGGEEKSMGELIVSGKKLEPDPIEGLRGWIPVTVKTVHDEERLYVRLEWPGHAQPPGRKLDPNTEAKVTVMLEDGHTVEAPRGGCWGVCHDDMIGMPSAPEGKAITKYLAASRTKITRQGGGENYKSDRELAGLLKKGVFYEYWQVRLNKESQPEAIDGYILEKRHENETPMVNVEAAYRNGKWVALFSRKLKPADPHHKDIVSGKSYFIGFAIHDAYTTHRFHHVSLEHTLVLDRGEADFVAVKQ